MMARRQFKEHFFDLKYGAGLKSNGLKSNGLKCASLYVAFDSHSTPTMFLGTYWCHR